MSSDAADSDGDLVQNSPRSSPTEENPSKVPKRFRKAAREKLKRDHMNELFSDLGRKLGLDHPNNGKDSVLRETIRLLGELVNQVDNLKEENAALLSESNYVMIEKDELLEETSGLDAEIKRLQKEINERVNCSNSDVSNPAVRLPEDQVATTPIASPVFVVPLHEAKGFSSSFPETNTAKVPSSVSRPQPRYPSSSDSWPSHILTR